VCSFLSNTEEISMKFDVKGFTKIAITFQFWLKLDNSNTFHDGLQAFLHVCQV
jgi:hypothetical protein